MRTGEQEQLERALRQLVDPGERAELKVRPWLACCIEPGEATLGPAKRRWELIQRWAELWLRDHHLQPQTRMVARGLLTTALRPATEADEQPAVLFPAGLGPAGEEAGE